VSSATPHQLDCLVIKERGLHERDSTALVRVVCERIKKIPQRRSALARGVQYTELRAVPVFVSYLTLPLAKQGSRGYDQGRTGADDTYTNWQGRVP